MSVEHHGALKSGHRLQEYRIERVLGFGGFGITYLATDTHLDKRVAIKEYLPADLAVRVDGVAIHPRATECREDFHWGLDRFLDEARTLARFRHPHLVPVHRFFEANGTAYMVMEYEPGERLTDILRRAAEPAHEAEVLALLDGLLDGLEAVHRAGYLHRDVKPGNIMVREDGTAVLIDFGAARQALGQRSQAVTSIVTPGYAPLEQYASDGNQGPWTDIYAVGAVAHQIVAGATPPEATMRVRNDPYRSLVGRAPAEYGASLLRAIDWALRMDEHDRPQSVAEFRRALHGEIAPPEPDAATRVDARSDRSTVLEAADRRRRGRRPAAAMAERRGLSGAHKLILIVAAALFFTVLGGGYYLLDRHQQEAEAARQRAEAAEQQRKLAEDRARAAAEQARQLNEQAKGAQAEREAAEKAAAEKAAADRAAADRAAADRAAAERAAQSAGSQRAAAEARDAAAKARIVSREARAMAEAARQRAALARDDAAVQARRLGQSGGQRREYDSGAVYVGQMREGRRHGYGVMTTGNGYRYEGEWRNDGAEGLGVSVTRDGDRYEGDWSGGQRERGVYLWPTGQRYEGDYQRSKRTGLGIMTSKSGWRTEARWNDGEIDGMAVTYNDSGQRYEGSMRDGQYDGPGVYTWPDGQRFEGVYKDDKRNGYGILYLANGTRRSGLWRDGDLATPD